MTGIKIEKVGGFDLRAELARIKSMAGGAVEVAGHTAALELIRGQQEGPATGREYKSKTGSGMHTASNASGAEQPHADTEGMIDALELDASGAKGFMPVVSVGWSGEMAKAAAAVYEGTADGRIAPRAGFHEAGQKGMVEAAAFVEGAAAISGEVRRVTGPLLSENPV